MKKISFIIITVVVSLFLNGNVFAITQNDWQSIENDSIYYNGDQSNCPGQSSTVSAPLSNGASIYILGDSITERSASAYTSSFQSYGFTANIDAQAGRALNTPGIDGTKTTGMQAIQQDKSQISSAGAIVVALGTNGGDTPSSIDLAIAAIRSENPTAPIYWVDTIVVGRPSYVPVIQQANEAIYGEASKDNYTVVSWFKTVDPNDNPLAPAGATDTNNYIDNSDGLGVHPTPAGIKALTNLVVSNVADKSSTTNVSATSCCASATTLSGSGNGVEAYNFFIQKGLTPAGAAGIVGNMTEESIGVDPERLQGNYTTDYSADSSAVQAVVNNGSYGWGIVQWTPPSKIVNSGPASSTDTLSYQLSFLWNELTTSYQSLLAQLKTASDPQVAASEFLSGYERGNPSPSREAYAQDYYNLAVHDTPLAPNVPVSNNQGGAAAASSSSGSANSSLTSAGGNSCGIPSTNGYMNPYRDLTQGSPMRIDEGVDYGGNGPIYPIGNAKVVLVDNGTAQWPGGNYITYQLTSGSYAGNYVYVAENCKPLVQTGQTVTPTTPLCTTTDNFPFTESGWSYAPTFNDTPMAICAYKKVPDGTATAYGYNFNQLLVGTGAQSGTWQYTNQAGGNNLAGTLPPGWPGSQASQQAANPQVFPC